MFGLGVLLSIIGHCFNTKEANCPVQVGLSEIFQKIDKLCQLKTVDVEWFGLAFMTTHYYFRLLWPFDLAENQRSGDNDIQTSKLTDSAMRSALIGSRSARACSKYLFSGSLAWLGVTQFPASSFHFRIVMLGSLDEVAFAHHLHFPHLRCFWKKAHPTFLLLISHRGAVRAPAHHRAVGAWKPVANRLAKP